MIKTIDSSLARTVDDEAGCSERGDFALVTATNIHSRGPSRGLSDSSTEELWFGRVLGGDKGRQVKLPDTVLDLLRDYWLKRSIEHDCRFSRRNSRL